MFKKNALFYLLALCLFVSVSCKKKEKEEPVSYWWKTFFAGNYKINGHEIATYKDAYTNMKVADFVKESELPEGDFNQYQLRIYLPTDTTLYKTQPRELQAELLVDGTSIKLLPNVARAGSVVMENLQYEIYEVEAFDSLSIGSKESYENFRVFAKMDYSDTTGSVIADREITIDIYKKR